jgi:hypothetical protein
MSILFERRAIAMTEQYHVISYRIKKTVKPVEVLDALETLLDRHSMGFGECLFRVQVYLCEFEHKGKTHTNRNRNAIQALLKQHPELEAFHHCSHTETEGSIVIGRESVGNFSPCDGTWEGMIPYDLIRDTVRQVPRPYDVNEMTLVYHGIGGEGTNSPRGRMERSSDGERSVGNYIWYERAHHGAEKHSYIYFSMESEKMDTMRRLFFDFAEIIPGTYEGTECLS